MCDQIQKSLPLVREDMLFIIIIKRCAEAILRGVLSAACELALKENVLQKQADNACHKN
jgi:hypothetical protein